MTYINVIRKKKKFTFTFIDTRGCDPISGYCNFTPVNRLLEVPNHSTVKD